MSNYESESGSYLLPVGEFNRVKKELILFWNDLVERQYNILLEIHQALSACPKRDVDETLSDAFYDRNKNLIPAMFEKALIVGANGRYKKPQKGLIKEFKTSVGQLKSGKTFLAEEGNLIIDPNSKRLRWSVGENNNAVRDARNHPLAGFLFSALSRVKWTAKTGGEVLYTNEFDHDDPYSSPECRDVYGFCQSNR